MTSWIPAWRWARDDDLQPGAVDELNAAGVRHDHWDVGGLGVRVSAS
jgi:hypothetical protein